MFSLSITEIREENSLKNRKLGCDAAAGVWGRGCEYRKQQGEARHK